MTTNVLYGTPPWSPLSNSRQIKIMAADPRAVTVERVRRFRDGWTNLEVRRAGE